MPKDIQLAPIFLPSTDPRVHSTPKEHPDEPPPSRRNRLVLALLVFLFSALLLSRDTSRYFLDLPSRDKSPPTSSDMSGIPRPNGKVSVGYFTNWGIYARAYKPSESDIPVESLTHLLYAFANIKDTGEVFLTDAWSDEQIHYDGDSWNDVGNNLYGNFKQLYLLKKKHCHLKVLLSIGGWTYSSAFAGPASTPQGREQFVTSSIKLLEDYGLDGLDIDWEYPKDATEAQHYVDLLRDLRIGLDRHAESKGRSVAQGFELTIAAPCGASNYEKLKVREMDQYLSFWNLMSYDYAGSWDTLANHQATLFDDGSLNALSTDRAIKYFTSNGVPVGKLVVGIPLYGRSFLETKGPGRPFNGIGKGSWEKGVYDYKALPLPGSTASYDPHLVASWTYNSTTSEFISYDSPECALAKAEFIAVNGLGGVMYWELSGDRKKGSKGAIVELVAGKLKESGMDRREACLEYGGSKWENLRKGME